MSKANKRVVVGVLFGWFFWVCCFVFFATRENKKYSVRKALQI